MKSEVRIIRLWAAVLLLAVAVTGCVEEVTSADEGPTMSAKVDGEDWSAGNNVAGTLFSSLKTVTGTPGDGSSITLTLTNVYDAGSFEVGSANAAATYIKDGDSFEAVNGTVEVTSLDESGNITGTFEFNGENQSGDAVAVTDGTFTTTLR